MRIPRPAVALAVLIALVALIASRQRRPPSPNSAVAEQEVLEALLSQGEMVVWKRKLIGDITSVADLLHGESYQAFSEKLRRDAKWGYRSSLRQLKDRFTGAPVMGYDDAFREAVEDFLHKNATSGPIVFATNSANNARLIPQAAVKEIFSSGRDPRSAWTLFRGRYPEAFGLITLSRVGFSSTGTVAIVYLGERSAGLAGSGQIRVLRRNGKKWVLDDLINIRWWIS